MNSIQGIKPNKCSKCGSRCGRGYDLCKTCRTNLYQDLSSYGEADRPANHAWKVVYVAPGGLMSAKFFQTAAEADTAARNKGEAVHAFTIWDPRT